MSISFGPSSTAARKFNPAPTFSAYHSQNPSARTSPGAPQNGHVEKKSAGKSARKSAGKSPGKSPGKSTEKSFENELHDVLACVQEYEQQGAERAIISSSAKSDTSKLARSIKKFLKAQSYRVRVILKQRGQKVVPAYEVLFDSPSSQKIQKFRGPTKPPKQRKGAPRDTGAEDDNDFTSDATDMDGDAHADVDLSQYRLVKKPSQSRKRAPKKPRAEQIEDVSVPTESDWEE